MLAAPDGPGHGDQRATCYSGPETVATPSSTRPASDSARCRFGLFEFDPRAGELRREGRPVKLSPQPARVLALLLSRPGEVVLREEFREHLWGNDTFVDFERGLNFCILQVRTALGDSSENPRFVQTVPRNGYRFIAPVPSPRRPRPSHLTHLPHLVATCRTCRTCRGARRPGRQSPRSPPSPLATAAAGRLAGRASAQCAGRLGRRPHAARRVALHASAQRRFHDRAGRRADRRADRAAGAARVPIGSRSSRARRRWLIATRPRASREIGRELDVSFVVESSLRREGDTLRIGSQADRRVAIRRRRRRGKKPST